MLGFFYSFEKPPPLPFARERLGILSISSDSEVDAGGGRQGHSGNMLSTLEIALIVVGSIVFAAILLFLLWPSISPMLRRSAKVPLTASLARGSDGGTSAKASPELPPLFAPV